MDSNTRTNCTYMDMHPGWNQQWQVTNVPPGGYWANRVMVQVDDAGCWNFYYQYFCPSQPWMPPNYWPTGQPYGQNIHRNPPFQRLKGKYSREESKKFIYNRKDFGKKFQTNEKSPPALPRKEMAKKIEDEIVLLEDSSEEKDKWKENNNENEEIEVRSEIEKIMKIQGIEVGGKKELTNVGSNIETVKDETEMSDDEDGVEISILTERNSSTEKGGEREIVEGKQSGKKDNINDLIYETKKQEINEDSTEAMDDKSTCEEMYKKAYPESFVENKELQSEKKIVEYEDDGSEMTETGSSDFEEGDGYQLVEVITDSGDEEEDDFERVYSGSSEEDEEDEELEQLETESSDEEIQNEEGRMVHQTENRQYNSVENESYLEDSQEPENFTHREGMVNGEYKEPNTTPEKQEASSEDIYEGDGDKKPEIKSKLNSLLPTQSDKDTDMADYYTVLDLCKEPYATHEELVIVSEGVDKTDMDEQHYSGKDPSLSNEEKDRLDNYPERMVENDYKDPTITLEKIETRSGEKEIKESSSGDDLSSVPLQGDGETEDYEEAEVLQIDDYGEPHITPEAVVTSPGDKDRSFTDGEHNLGGISSFELPLTCDEEKETCTVREGIKMDNYQKRNTSAKKLSSPSEGLNKTGVQRRHELREEFAVPLKENKNTEEPPDYLGDDTGQDDYKEIINTDPEILDFWDKDTTFGNREDELNEDLGFIVSLGDEETKQTNEKLDIPQEDINEISTNRETELEKYKNSLPSKREDEEDLEYSEDEIYDSQSSSEKVELSDGMGENCVEDSERDLTDITDEEYNSECEEQLVPSNNEEIQEIETFYRDKDT